MFRRKWFVIKSTISHMHIHKSIVSLLLILLSLIFFVQLIFSGFILTYNDERFGHISWDESLYYSSQHQIRSTDVEDVVSELFPFRERIQDIYISGVIPNSYYNNASLFDNTDVEVSVIAFVTDISPERLGGKVDPHRFDKYDFYMENSITSMILLPNNESTETTEEASNTWNEALLVDKEYMINEKIWRAKGTVSFEKLIYADSSAYIMVSYDQFFEIAEYCTSIKVQFEKPLSESELMHLNQRMSSIGLSSVTFSSNHGIGEDVRAAVFFIEYAAITAVMLLLMINLFSLFEYLVSLRKSEFQVYLLTGGTKATIWKCALWELTLCSILAAGLGGLIMLAPFCRILLNESIWASYLKFFVANATLFIVFAVLSFVIRMKMFRMEKKFMFSERGSK